MRILAWHVHGSWMTAFVQGEHEVLVPVLPDRGPDGRGRAQTWEWPERVREIPVDALADTAFDVVLLQRPHEIDLVTQWTGRRPGIDVRAVYVEHNTPKESITGERHPVADRADIELVHVSHFNHLFWDNGCAPTRVIEHGIVDPGHRWSGELARAAVAINEPVRRDRVTGTDLIARFARAAPVDVFGMGLTGMHERYGLAPDRVQLHENVPQQRMHARMARRRVYIHTARWTSLGLSLLEAMYLGMPIVAVGATEAPAAVPPQAGYVGTDIDRLCEAVEHFMGDWQAAFEAGEAARQWVQRHYGLDRFLQDWDNLLSTTPPTNGTKPHVGKRVNEVTV